MNGVYQVKERKRTAWNSKQYCYPLSIFSTRHYTNVNKMSLDLLRREMPIQDSSIKDELINELELYGAILMQDSSLKDELVLRRSPSKFIDGHCNISLICVCFLLINASFLMTM